MSSHLSNSPPRKQSRMTAATDAALIIAREYMDRVAEKAATASDDELRLRVRKYVDKEIKYAAQDGVEAPDDLPDPEALSRQEMIDLLVYNAGGCPPTFAIPEDEDDPLVFAAQELRSEAWERDVAAAIKSMGLSGPAADRHRATAEQAELKYLRELVEETWELPEADLRLRAVEIVSKLAGGTEDDKKFPYEPDRMSRGHLLAAIADHIEWLTWSPELRRNSRLAAE
jgi:hypothetical protein